MKSVPASSSSRDKDSVERACQAYLERVAAGEAPRLAEHELELGSDAERSAYRLEALSCEWSWRRDQGQIPKLELFLACLETPAQREQFLAQIEAARSAARQLPYHCEEGAVVAGRYLVRTRLGQGGGGVVWEALDLDLERTVALKSLRTELGVSGQALARSLLEESKILAALRDAHIVTVFDVLR